ncbi:hypothetical protein [Wolbachia endosymbiont of Madathamugadia hiepei]|nr:hypothetical protein [Wolbachia endosymbiont of Madathamugadia hiepei]
MTLESSEKKEWIPVSGHWDDTLLIGMTEDYAKILIPYNSRPPS